MKWKPRISSLKVKNYTKNKYPGKELWRSKTANASLTIQSPKLRRNILLGIKITQHVTKF